MADSKVIQLGEWFGKEVPNGGSFPDAGRASRDECLRMIRAFTRIQEPSIRRLLLRSAEAASKPHSDDPLSLERFRD
jgi:hypothetical protein